MAPTSSHVSHFDIPNASSKTKTHDQIAGVIPKTSPAERKINISSESDESLSNYSRIQTSKEHENSPSMTEDSVKSIRYVSKSQKRSMKLKQ